jgi:hypothetical protein
MLKAAVPRVLERCTPLAAVVVEGDRLHADIWERGAALFGAPLLRVAPETWRKTQLLPREQRHGADAKKASLRRALDVIDACGGQKPKTPMKHDVAEAILLGMHGLSVLAQTPTSMLG